MTAIASKAGWIDAAEKLKIRGQAFIGGKCDKSIHAIHEYSDLKTTWIRSENRCGLAAAHNTATKRSDAWQT
jgi:hypothetical protein